jgi:hypothetical protein
MQFRRGALAKREAPDELTAAVRVVPARGWPFVVLLAVVVAGGVGWGLAGRGVAVWWGGGGGAGGGGGGGGLRAGSQSRRRRRGC